MKLFLNVLLIALLFASHVTSNKLELSSDTGAVFDKNWMLGVWIGKGYKCGLFSRSIDEDINVTYEGGEFVATKINGDACVNSGIVTFRGSLSNEYDTNGRYKCVITLGNAFRPQSSHNSNCNVVPIDENNFKVVNWNLTFTRKGPRVPLELPKPVVTPPPTVISPPPTATPTPTPTIVVSPPPVIAPPTPAPVRIYPHNFFLGFWIGDGYRCNTTSPTKEDVHISYGDNEWSAVKVHGDDCVNKGKVTFKVTLQPDWRPDSRRIPCILTLGSPSKPQSSSTDKCYIDIVDDNKFILKDWGITFVRGRLPTPGLIYPYEYFLGGWIGKGYTCSNVEGMMTQEVEINYNEGTFIATKIQGDDCVNEGQVSFSGVLQERFEYCKIHKTYHIPCSIFFGTPTNPHSALSITCRVEILDVDTFRIPQWNLLFRRKGCFTMPKELEKENEALGGF